MIDDIYEINVDDFEEVRYLLGSQLRIKILRLLLESDMTLDNIKEYIHKQDTNLLRTLKELQDINLVESDNEKYTLTSTGYLAIRNIMNVFYNFNTINKYERCINYHSFKKFPFEVAKFMYLIDETERIESPADNIYKTRRLYDSLVNEAKDLKIILPIYSKQYLESLFKTIKENDANIEFITSRNIYEAIKESKFGEEFKEFKSNGKIRLWVTEDDVHEIFLTVTEKRSSICFSFKDETFDDTTFFWKEDYKNKEMLYYFFENYKHKMLSKEII